VAAHRTDLALVRRAGGDSGVVGAAVGGMKRLIVVVVVITAAGRGAAAQVPDSAGGHTPPFFTYRDAVLAGAFALGTVAMFPIDKTFAGRVQRQNIQENRTLHDAANFFGFMGRPFPQIAAPVLYGVGRLTHQRRVAALGLHGAEAMILSTALTSALKLSLGRARPYVYHDSNSTSFAFMRGFKGHDFESFPSGHTTTAFSVASAVTAETSHWADQGHWFRGSKLLIGTVMYGGATLVGLSRAYHDQHWASDIVAGAAIGTFSGIKVVRFDYRHPQNRLDRWLLSAQVSPGPDGSVVVAWSAHTPLGSGF